MIVTAADFRTIPGFSSKPGFCASGGRAWFQRHGLDWRDFIRNGIEADRLLATRDGLAIAIVEHARTRAEDTARGQ